MVNDTLVTFSNKAHMSHKPHVRKYKILYLQSYFDGRTLYKCMEMYCYHVLVSITIAIMQLHTFKADTHVVKIIKLYTSHA